MNILLVEDNESIAKGLKYNLETNNYNVLLSTSIKETNKIIKSNIKIDLIILDVMLPDGNGFDYFKSTILSLNLPTIFLTAKDDENDIVHGLTIGAEDYLTKPFSTKELLVRINKIILRTKKQNIITVKDIKFNIDKMIFYKNDKKIELTSLELKLLSLLFMNIDKVVTRTQILDKIWELTGNDIDDHTVTVYFNRIREKLDSNIITTVKGIGYRIDHEK